MFLRLLWESFARQRRRKLLAGVAIFLGVTAVTAMLGLATTIGDRIHRELAVYGANIVIYPKADTLDVKIGDQTLRPATGNAYLHESDLAKLRGIFWANNITGISPELPFTVADAKTNEKPVEALGLWFSHSIHGGTAPLVTGAPQLHPLWKVEGSWPEEAATGSDTSQIAVGSALASTLHLQIGDTLLADLPSAAPGTQPMVAKAYVLHIVGIVKGDPLVESKILAPLEAAQAITGAAGLFSRAEVTATTKPEDAFARRDPDTLKPKERDIWYCRPYANSIAYQIREAIPGAQAEQVRQVEQTQGTILERISGLMWLVSLAALLAAAVAVSAAMATTVLERQAEIGLMRSLGASKARVASLFYAESGLLAVLAGVVGYAAGCIVAAVLSARIFGGAVLLSHAFIPVLLPVVLGVALLVALAGSAASIQAALRLDPNTVLRASA